MKPSVLAALFSLFMSTIAFAASETKRVALVFDDGPTAEQCLPLLGLLAHENVHVTFSHVGRSVAALPELAQKVSDAGHEIANHSYTHPHLKDLEAAEIAREVTETHAAIEAAIGHAPRWFWAPFLEWDDHMAAAIAPTGVKHFPISQVHLVSSDDWNSATDAAGILKNATSGIEDRTVILFHEWRAETLAKLPEILAELRRQGCTFLTFSELAATLTPEQLAVAR